MITVNIASARGHDVEEFEEGAIALDFIRNKAAQENKWVFVDGEMIADLNMLEVDRVVNAQDITMSNQLTGG